MPSRSRVRDVSTLVRGYFYDNRDSPRFEAYQEQGVGVRTTCDDHHGNGPVDNPFDLFERDRAVTTLGGEDPTGSVGFSDMPIGGLNPPPYGIPGMPGLGASLLEDYYWETLAATNPNRPHVNVPQFIGELKDLPSLVRGWGQGLARTAAQANLTYWWAAKPMISDISKMMTFAQSVSQRMEWLHRLGTGKAIKGRKRLDSGGGSDLISRNELVNSLGRTVRADVYHEYDWQTWGTVRWTKDPSAPDFPIYRPTDLHRLASRMASGLTLHGALETAWELLPWSWLVDWFSNVGTMIAATNNTVPLVASPVCVCRTSNSRRVYKNMRAPADGWITFSGPTYWVDTRKQRIPYSAVIPFPTPSIPCLTARQWSLLGSLAVLKGRPRS